MTLGLFMVTVAVALLWSGGKNKDLREAIPLFFSNKDPNDAGPISKELPSDEPVPFGAGGGGGANLGGQVTWSKSRVALYTIQLARAFGVSAGGQCRQDGVVPAYGSSNSLHFNKNGCRARDFFGSDDKLKKLEAWAKKQGVFAEVLYTGVAGHGPGMGGTRHLHLGFPKSGKMPVIPGIGGSGLGGY
jgi:hypothetical protein